MSKKIYILYKIAREVSDWIFLQAYMRYTKEIFEENHALAYLENAASISIIVTETLYMRFSDFSPISSIQFIASNP